VEIGSHSPLQSAINFQNEITLSHEQNIFSFTFAALSFFDPMTNRYRFKLEGLDQEWNEVGSDRRSATYTTLSPGRYTFLVQGAISNGPWSEPVTLTVRILPPWWRTWWFMTIVLAFSPVAALAAYYYRRRQMILRFDMLLEERVSERTRIARELHDSLLQGVQGLMFRLQAVRDMLDGHVSDKALHAFDIALERGDKAIAESRDTVADLRESIIRDSDIHQALSALSEELALQSSNGTAPSVSVLVEGKPRELDLLVRDEVYRIAREALRNAFRHAKAQKIEAEISYGDSEFMLHVRDDGSGIESAVVNQGGRAGHWGLLGMRERATRFGGQVEVWSERGAATEIQLAVPASVAYGTPEPHRRFWFWRRKTGESNE
jgi:signal transduction histidine kinase